MLLAYAQPMRWPLSGRIYQIKIIKSHGEWCWQTRKWTTHGQYGYAGSKYQDMCISCPLLAFNWCHSDSKHDASLTGAMTGLKQVHSSDQICLEAIKILKVFGNSGCPKVKDYNDMTQGVLIIAIGVYCWLICTVTPFLDHVKELEFVMTGWVMACRKLNIWLEMTLELVKMIFICCVHWYQLMRFHFTDHLSWVPCPWWAQDKGPTGCRKSWLWE